MLKEANQSDNGTPIELQKHLNNREDEVIIQMHKHKKGIKAQALIPSN